MTMEEAKRLFKYGQKEYDELNPEQKEFVDKYWDAMAHIMARVFATKPYKVKIPCEWNGNSTNVTQVKPPPKNYREEHEQFIERIIHNEEDNKSNAVF